MRRLAALAGVLGLAACSQSPLVEPGEREPDKLAELHTKMAVEYMREDKNDVAMERLKKALSYDRNHAPAHNTLGVLYARLGETDKAERHFRESVDEEPVKPAHLNNYGQFLCGNGRIEDGRAMFRRALENPLYQHPEVAHTNAGTCALRAGDIERAEDSFRAALQINPEFPIALREMAHISYQTNRYLSARGYLQRYREVAPHTAATLWLGVRVERALGDLDTAASYALTLRSKFPDSDETKLLQQSEGE